MEYPELLMVIYMPFEIVSVQKRYCNERERERERERYIIYEMQCPLMR